MRGAAAACALTTRVSTPVYARELHCLAFSRQLRCVLTGSRQFRPLRPRWQASFSCLLCLGGFVNAAAGFSANGGMLRDALRRRLDQHAGVVRRSFSCSALNAFEPPAFNTAPYARSPMASPRSAYSVSSPEGSRGEQSSVQKADISSVLRVEIVTYTMHGIQARGRSVL